MNREGRRYAFLYCKFRDDQYALYDEWAKRNGLLMNTFLVMNTLFYAKEGMTQKQVCDTVHLSKQTVSLIIKNLVRDGNVEFETDPSDGRSALVQMTEAGRLQAEGPVRHITWAEDTAMSMLTPEEQEQLVTLSRRFTQHLTELVRGAGNTVTETG